MAAATRIGAAAAAVMLAAQALCASGATAAGKSVPLPVPRVAIYPGDTIDDALIIERNFAAVFVPRLAAIENRGDLAGMVAKRTLLPGHPIPVNAVRMPDAVSAGVPVKLVFQSGALQITALATPLKSAQVGQAVSVRNIESGRTVSGIVQADGSVLVAPL